MTRPHLLPKYQPQLNHILVPSMYISKIDDDQWWRRKNLEGAKHWQTEKLTQLQYILAYLCKVRQAQFSKWYDAEFCIFCNFYHSTYLEFDPEFQSLGSRFTLIFEPNNLFSDFLCSNIESTYYMPDTFSMPWSFKQSDTTFLCSLFMQRISNKVMRLA